MPASRPRPRPPPQRPSPVRHPPWYPWRAPAGLSAAYRNLGEPPAQRLAWRAGPVRVGWLSSGPGGLLAAADVRQLRFLRAAGRAGPQLGGAVGAHRPDGGDLLAQRLVADTAAPRGAQVMSRSREQAGVQHPSAESRARVQPRQNGWVTEATTPISPAPSWRRCPCPWHRRVPTPARPRRAARRPERSSQLTRPWPALAVASSMAGRADWAAPPAMTPSMRPRAGTVPDEKITSG